MWFHELEADGVDVKALKSKPEHSEEAEAVFEMVNEILTLFSGNPLEYIKFYNIRSVDMKKSVINMYTYVRGL